MIILQEHEGSSVKNKRHITIPKYEIVCSCTSGLVWKF